LVRYFKLADGVTITVLSPLPYETVYATVTPLLFVNEKAELTVLLSTADEKENSNSGKTPVL
jgi:hypothetical protein